MKRLILFLLGLTIVWDVALGAEINLKALWVPNAESDMKEYRLYRTDSGKTLVGVIPHPGQFHQLLSYGFQEQFERSHVCSHGSGSGR